MTLEELLADMNAAAGDGRVALRRAYLRAVKLHSPERDPAGFQRVREAFERLRALDDEGQQAIQAILASAETDSQPATQPSRTAPDARDHAPELEQAAPMSNASPRDSGEPAVQFENVVLALDELPEGANEQQIAEACRGVTAQNPQSAAVAWAVVSWLQDRELPKVSAELLREAHARGHSGFLRALLFQHGRLATDQEIREAESSADPALHQAAVNALLEQRRPTRAARLAVRRLDAATQGDGPPPDPQACLALIAECLAAGDRKMSEALHAAFRRYLELSGAEAGFLYGELAARWLLVTELVAVGPRLPSSVELALADVVRGKDPHVGFVAIDRLAAENTRRARLVVERLEVSAPSLYALIGSPTITEDRRWGSAWWPLAGIWIMVMGVARMCSASSERSSSSQRPPELRRPAVSADAAPAGNQQGR